MGLTRKTGLVIGVGLVLLLGVVELLSVTLVMGGFRALESDLAAKDAERLREAVAEAHAQLDLKASDWAGWDDTYEFMVSRSPAYIESNLNSESLEMLGLCGAAYLDLDGRVVLARGFGGPGEPMVDPCPEMIAIVERDASLRTAPEGVESRHGVVISPSGEPLLVAVRPILTSQQTGPSRGVLVFAQRLDEMMVSRFERLLRQGVTIRPSSEWGDRLGAGSVIRVATERDVVHTYVPIHDLSGRPLLVGRVSSGRDVTARGWAAVRFSLLVVLGTGLALGVATARAVRVLVIDPVQRMSAEMSRIAASGSASGRVTAGGSDELGELARDVNLMLGALERTAADLERAREEAEAAVRSKADFLAAISHEVRSPLAVVVGSADLLGEAAGGNGECARHAEAIARNARHLLVVINDLLDHSKLEAGRMTIESIPYSPRVVAREALEIVRPKAEAKGLELRDRLGGRLVEEMIGDPTRVRQILLNLLFNAVKFTEQGHVELRGSMGPSDAGIAHVVFEVHDSGVGVSPDEAERLFHSFEQASASTARRYGGTGLGLSISRALAEQMGGTIRLRSTPGRGSTFTVTLPAGPLGALRHTSEEGTAARGPAPAPGGTPFERSSLVGLRVLVVDDAEDMRRLIRHHLDAAGAMHEGADSGDAAVALAGERFDAIVLDLNMPGMDGWETARRLRAAGCPSALLAATADDREAVRDRCLTVGFVAVLVKPVDPEALIRAVARAVGPGQRRAA